MIESTRLITRVPIAVQVPTRVRMPTGSIFNLIQVQLCAVRRSVGYISKV